jgi:hypothetical protein
MGPDGPQGVEGAIGPTGPTGPSGTTGQSSVTVLTAATYNTTTANAFVPGLQQTVIVPEDSVVMIQTNGGFQTNAPSIGGFSIVDVTVFIDGVFQTGMRRRVTAANVTLAEQAYGYWEMAQTFALVPGSHLIQVAATHSATGSAAFLGGVVNSPRQAGLTVTVLKQ